MATETDVGKRALDAMRETQDTKITTGQDITPIRGEYECSICRQDLQSCLHWPGQSYLVDGKQVLCRALIHNNHVQTDRQT